MRLPELEIKGKKDLADILERADVCRIALAAGNTPYIVALNFGYEWNDAPTLYFHCASEGRMIDFMKVNAFVCFQADIDHVLVAGKTACRWGMGYKSVVGYGTLKIVEAEEERRKALDLIMAHYGGKRPHSYNEKTLERTCVLSLRASEIVGKKREK